MSLDNFLSTTPAVHCGSKQVAIVNANDSVQYAFEVLLNFKVLSAPVFDEANNEYIGMVDIIDIVSFILMLYGEEEEPNEGPGDTWKNFLSQDVFNKIPVKDVTDLSLRDPFVPVPSDACLIDVVKVLVAGRDKGVHRVCTVDKDGLVESVISQSGVLKAIDEAVKSDKVKLPEGALAKQISELETWSKTVLTIKESDKAINAFRLMNKERVSGVALVDDDGQLVGNISARDLRAVREQEDTYWFKDLFLSCMDLVAKVRRGEILENSNRKTRSPIMSCQESDTLEQVINKLIATRVHRLYVVSDDKKLVGVVSLRDILHALLKL